MFMVLFWPIMTAKSSFFHGEIFLGVITQNGMITLKKSQ